jgi:two-component system sensor histidine kinase AlgZ
MRPEPPPTTTSDRERSGHLPDLCESGAVLAVVLVSTLVAFVIALARQSVSGELWTELARTSAYLLWTALLAVALLCRARPWLARQSLVASTVASLALIVGAVALVSEAVYWFGRWWDGRLGTASGLFPLRHAAFLLPNLAIGAIVGGLVLRYFYVSAEWRRSVELEARARERALQARIRPHFLYNSLNTIAALTRSDPTRAEGAIEDLSDLFRVALAESRPQIGLREELEIARTYQRIEQLRLGARLQVDWDVDALPGDAVVPGLLLQPLLENAIYHGVEPLPEGGRVTVTGRVVDDGLEIVVTNPLAPAPRTSRPGHRMALDNIRERLELAYPGRSSVTARDEGGQYRVALRFPRVRADVAGDHG